MPPQTPGGLTKKIRLTVVASDGLVKRDMFRLPDPFAVITVDGEQTHSTSIIKRTLNPYWNENFDITVKDSSVVIVHIFDQRKFKRHDQGFLGVANVQVSEAIDLELGGHEMLTLDLKQSHDNLPVHGKLIIYISTNTSSPIPNPGPSASSSANPLNDLQPDVDYLFLNAIASTEGPSTLARNPTAAAVPANTNAVDPSVSLPTISLSRTPTETTIKTLLDDMMEDVFAIRRPFHARSLALVSQCRILKQHIASRGYESSEGELLIEVLKECKIALKAAINAVPSMETFHQDSPVPTVAQIDKAVALIIKCFTICGLVTKVGQFKDDFERETKRDQDAIVLFGEEIQRRKNRPIAALSTETTVRLKIKLCVESMDAPNEIELGRFDTNTRLNTILWKLAQPKAKKRVALSPHSNFYVRKSGHHPHTKDGVIFERLNLDQQISSLPEEDGIVNVYLVVSEGPYIMITRGTGARSDDPYKVALRPSPSRPVLVKDLRIPLQKVAFELHPPFGINYAYRAQNISTGLVIKPHLPVIDQQGDIIEKGVQYYQGSWLITRTSRMDGPREGGRGRGINIINGRSRGVIGGAMRGMPGREYLGGPREKERVRVEPTERDRERVRDPGRVPKKRPVTKTEHPDEPKKGEGERDVRGEFEIVPVATDAILFDYPTKVESDTSITRIDFDS